MISLQVLLTVMKRRLRRVFNVDGPFGVILQLLDLVAYKLAGRMKLVVIGHMLIVELLLRWIIVITIDGDIERLVVLSQLVLQYFYLSLIVGSGVDDNVLGG